MRVIKKEEFFINNIGYGDFLRGTIISRGLHTRLSIRGATIWLDPKGDEITHYVSIVKLEIIAGERSEFFIHSRLTDDLSKITEIQKETEKGNNILQVGVILDLTEKADKERPYILKVGERKYHYQLEKDQKEDYDRMKLYLAENSLTDMITTTIPK